MQAISTVGFPIVMCGAAVWFIKYLIDKNKDELSELTTSHREEMDKITEALNNNTVVMQKLIDALTFGGELTGDETDRD